MCLWVTLSQMMRCCQRWLFVLEGKVHESIPMLLGSPEAHFSPSALSVHNAALGITEFLGLDSVFRGQELLLRLMHFVFGEFLRLVREGLG